MSFYYNFIMWTVFFEWRVRLLSSTKGNDNYLIAHQNIYKLNLKREIKGNSSYVNIYNWLMIFDRENPRNNDIQILWKPQQTMVLSAIRRPLEFISRLQFNLSIFFFSFFLRLNLQLDSHNKSRNRFLLKNANLIVSHFEEFTGFRPG